MTIPYLEVARKTLNADQVELVDVVWKSYAEAAGTDWPLASATRLQFGRKRAVAALKSLPAGIILAATSGDRYVLTLYGVFLASSGKESFALFVRFLEFLRTPEGRVNAQLQAATVRDALSISDRESTLLGMLIHLSWLRVGTSRLGPEWQCGLPGNMDEIVELESVERYVEDEARRYAADSAQRETELAAHLAPGRQAAMKPANQAIRLFISHSSRDLKLATALIHLLRSSLNLPATAIRCTSVDGYRLPGGADTNVQLRREVHDAEAFVGIVSAEALQSLYVLFELGARWGAGRQLIPLLPAGTPGSMLGGPLAVLNALRADNRAQLLQLVNDVGATLAISPQPPAAYEDQIKAILELPPSSRPATLGEQSADSLQRVLQDTERQVLRSVAVAGGSRIALFDLERNVGMNQLRLHRALDGLRDRALVEVFNVVPEGDAVSLTPEGRDYVIEHHLDS